MSEQRTPSLPPSSLPFGSALLVFASVSALTVARAAHHELQRWPNSFLQPARPTHVLSESATFGALALAVAVVASAVLGGRRWRFVLRRLALLAAPLGLAPVVAVGLYWPIPGVTRATALLVATATAVAVARSVRSRIHSPSGDRLALALAVSILIGALVGALAIGQHEPEHAVTAIAGVVRLTDLRQAERGLGVGASRVLPPHTSVAIEAPAGSGVYVRFRCDLPARVRGRVTDAALMFTDEAGMAPLRVPVATCVSGHEPIVVRLPPRPDPTPLRLMLEGDLPALYLRSLSVGPRPLLTSVRIGGVGDLPRHLMLAEADASAWLRVQAVNESRSALVVPVPAERCLPIRPTAGMDSLGVTLADGLPTGEIEVRATARDGAGTTTADWQAPLSTDGWLEVPLDLTGAREICLETRGASDLGWSVAWSEPRAPIAAMDRNRLPPNVVLISIDTLRADAASAYGGEAMTPAFDAFAAEGVLFENAISAAAWTLPSHASMLTGVLPSRHDAWGDIADLPGRVIDPGLATLAERLRAHGYLTLGSVGGGFVSSTWGFARGFDRFLEVPRSSPDGQGKDRDQVWAGATSLLEGMTEPFFLFLHSYSVHTPYGADPPPPGSTYASDPQAAWAQYLAGVTYTDGMVQSLRDELTRRGIGDRTVVAITSDHGEEFADHHAGVFVSGHGHSVFEEVVHVPLIVTGPGLQRGRRIVEAVSLTDLAPTLLDLVGAAPLGDVDGRSLKQSLLSGEAAARRVLVSECATGALNLKSARLGPAKLIRDSSGNRPRCYDLDEDPDELRPRADCSDLAVLSAALAGLRRTPRPLTQPATALDDDLEDRLRGLGYLR